MSLGASLLQGPSDEELVHRFQSTGDQACFSELFERHKRKVYLSCRSFFHEANAAEDATQEAFFRAFRSLDGFVTGDFAGWLMRIARNVCIDQWRRQRHEVELEQDLTAVPAKGSLEHSVEFRLAAQSVLEAMTKLPADQRRCLELKIDGYSYEESASLTGLTVGAVKSHLQNGRRMLWVRLGKARLH